MHMKNMTDYALMGMRQALEELEAEKIKLQKTIEKLQNGVKSNTKSLQKAWAARHSTPIKMRTLKGNHKIPTMRGYSYRGKHWTQTPEGKKRMSEIQKLRLKNKGAA